MPPRAASDSGKLDEISLRIGELSGYVHEHRHGVNNLSAKFDAVALDMTRRVEALDVKMTIRIDEINANLTTRLEAANARIGVLESIQDQQKGARNLASWLLQSPVVAWLAALAGLIAAFWTGTKAQ
jgi:hypothetical protein